MAGPGGRAAAAAPVDPVRELLDVHRELCEQAVDVLDIAAGLEDAGVGAGAAGYYRHADVFGLAEELYARVPRRPAEPGPPEPGGPRGRRAGAAFGTALLHLVPVLAVAAARAVVPEAGLPVLVGVLLPAAAGPALAAPAGLGGDRPGRGVVARWAGRAGYGMGAALLLGLSAATGGTAVAVAAALGAGSARWCAGWLRRAGRANLGSAVTVAEFRARMRPVLPVAAALHLALLVAATLGAQAAAAAPAPGGQVGGRPGSGSAGLLPDVLHRISAAEWAAQGVLGLVLLLAAVLPRCGRAVQPALAVGAVLLGGVGAVAAQALGFGAAGRLAVCGAPAALLLPYVWVLLGRPGAHRD